MKDEERRKVCALNNATNIFSHMVEKGLLSKKVSIEELIEVAKRFEEYLEGEE